MVPKQLKLQPIIILLAALGLAAQEPGRLSFVGVRQVSFISLGESTCPAFGAAVKVTAEEHLQVLLNMRRVEANQLYSRFTFDTKKNEAIFNASKLGAEAYLWSLAKKYGVGPAVMFDTDTGVISPETGYGEMCNKKGQQ